MKNPAFHAHPLNEHNVNTNICVDVHISESVNEDGKY